MMISKLGWHLKVFAWGAIKRWIRFKFPEIVSLSTTDLAVWLQQENTEKPLLLDARNLTEYEVSHLPQAHLVPKHLPDVRHWHGVTLSVAIVTYCSVGYRSAVLAQQLQKMGYEKVFNLEGSMFQWVNEGRLVYQTDQVVRQVHPYNQLWGLLLDPTYPQSFHVRRVIILTFHEMWKRGWFALSAANQPKGEGD